MFWNGLVQLLVEPDGSLNVALVLGTGDCRGVFGEFEDIMSLIQALLAFLNIFHSFIELRLFEDEGDESILRSVGFVNMLLLSFDCLQSSLNIFWPDLLLLYPTLFLDPC